MALQGIEQDRAAYAYECAADAAKLASEKAKEYRSHVKKIPMMIKTNGLGATLAFIFSKGNEGGRVQLKKSYGLMYQQLEDWLTKEKYQRVFYLEGTDSHKTLVERIIQLDSAKYRAATVEVLTLLGWTRRFAEGLIEGGKEKPINQD